VLTGAVVGLAVGCVQVLRHRLKHEPIPPILLIGILLTLFLGGVSVFIDDPRVIMLKPSIIYTAIAVPMARRGWIARYIPDIARELLSDITLDRVGWGWAVLMAGTAAANVALVVTLPPHRAALAFTVGALLAKLALFAGQYSVLRRRAGRTYRAREADVSGERARS
jgi:intracellular septation protein